MAIYTPMQDAGIVPGSVASDGNAYQFCLFFEVTEENCQINGVGWYCGTGQYDNSLGDEQIGLFTVTGEYTFVLVEGSLTTAGIYTPGGWNEIEFGSPIALEANTEYAIIKGISAAAGDLNYTQSALVFSSGEATNGVTDGPVLVYADFAGTSNKEPTGAGQQSFKAGGAGAAPPPLNVDFPNMSFDASFYGMDVQIETSGGETGTGGLALQPLAAAGTGTTAITGTGGLELAPLAMTGSGTTAITGTGALALQPLGIKTPSKSGGSWPFDAVFDFVIGAA